MRRPGPASAYRTVRVRQLLLGALALASTWACLRREGRVLEFTATSPPSQSFPLGGQSSGSLLKVGDSLLVLLTSTTVRHQGDPDIVRLARVRLALAASDNGGSWTLLGASRASAARAALGAGDSAMLDTLAFVLALPAPVRARDPWLVVVFESTYGLTLGHLHAPRDLLDELP